MKSIEEIKKTPRLMVSKVLSDGFIAFGELRSTKGFKNCKIIGSWGGGWDHVSVSFRGRTPTWEEMAEIKKMLFYPEEVCVEYHPPESEYVNYHPYVLHMFRPQNEVLPRPPYWMIGPKNGQSESECRAEANAYLDEYEKRKGARA